MGTQLAFWWVSVFDNHHASNIRGWRSFWAHFANSRRSRRRQKQSKGKLKLIFEKYWVSKMDLSSLSQMALSSTFFFLCWEREFSIFYLHWGFLHAKLPRCNFQFLNCIICIAYCLYHIASRIGLCFLLRKYLFWIYRFLHTSVLCCAFHPVISNYWFYFSQQRKL